MRKIYLTQGAVALIDNYDFDLVKQYRWRLSSAGYAHAHGLKSSKEDIAMHRLVLGLRRGDGQLVDHIDNDKLNNQKSNLRLCTATQNCANRTKRTGCSSQYKGVYWNKQMKKRRSKLDCEGMHIFLGHFDDEEDATRAYDKAALQYFREFATLNLGG